jgi:hypothetical protein
MDERLRQKSNLSSRIKLFLPVQSLREKFSASQFPQITFLTVPSHPTRGAYRDRHGRGVDAMDAAALLTNSAKADGEVVWS